MSSPVISIIGGKGAMGAALALFFRRHKLRVLVADLHTALTPEAACRRADITIFSVPIRVTPRVIAHVAPFAKRGSLLADVTSLKAPAIKAFTSYAAKNVEILGLHPLFAPGAMENLGEQVIAACSERDGPRSRWLRRLLTSSGAIIVDTTPREHDKLMAIVQGITHFSAIASALALSELKVNLRETLKFASPVYMLRLAMIGRILNQSPQLYAQIEIENSAMQPVVAAYQKAIADLARTVAAGDEQKFEKLFKQAAKFLGPFKKKAQELTDEIIEGMAIIRPRTQ